MHLLKHLVIKPLLYCNLGCPYCIARQATFKKSRTVRLGVEDWAALFHQANQLGTEYLDISGGEPTLYPPLPALVWEAKQYGWYVSVNTSGNFLTRTLLRQLEAVCLDQIIVSLISLDTEINNTTRKARKGLNSAFNAIRLLRDSPIRCVVHCIIARQNFTEIPAIIRFAFESKVNALALVYPENDYIDKYLLMTPDDREQFRSQHLPLAVHTYRQCYQEYVGTEPPEKSTQNLAGLYSAAFTDGCYFDAVAEAMTACHKPYTFLLVYANGDVLPCNGVEYTGAPLMGNVCRNSLSEIWNSEQMTQFREKRISYCRYCPVPHHTGVAVMTTDNPPYAAPVVKRIPPTLAAERPFVENKYLKTRNAKSYAAS